MKGRWRETSKQKNRDRWTDEERKIDRGRRVLRFIEKLYSYFRILLNNKVDDI